MVQNGNKDPESYVQFHPATDSHKKKDSHPTPAEYLAARVRMALNYASDLQRLCNKLASTQDFEIEELSYTKKGRTVTLRRYDARKEVKGVQDVTLYELVEPPEWEESDTNTASTPGKLRKYKAKAKKVTYETTSFWEVEYQHNPFLDPATYVYLSARSATETHLYLYGEVTGKEKLMARRGIMSRLPALLASTYKGIAPAKGIVRPKRPIDRNAPGTAQLEARAEVARGSTAPNSLALKDLAVEIYRNGETNIRRVSKVTGLSRDTIYLLLYAEDLKEFRYSHIVREVRSRIESGQLLHGTPAPTQEEIATQWGIPLSGAQKVLAILRASELIRTTPGLGTVVYNKWQHPVPQRRYSASTRHDL